MAHRKFDGMNYSDKDFPLSFNLPFLITSPRTVRYNCIAYVYGDPTRVYWPDPDLITFYWPKLLPRVVHLDSFISLYRTIGYQVCQNGDLELPFEKIAIFGVDPNNPKHAAKQLFNGNWSSKLGSNYDVSHSILNISNGVYGNVLCYMRRPRIK